MGLDFYHDTLVLQKWAKKEDPMFFMYEGTTRLQLGLENVHPSSKFTARCHKVHISACSSNLSAHWEMKLKMINQTNNRFSQDQMRWGKAPTFTFCGISKHWRDEPRRDDTPFTSYNLLRGRNCYQNGLVLVSLSLSVSIIETPTLMVELETRKLIFGFGLGWMINCKLQGSEICLALLLP